MDVGSLSLQVSGIQYAPDSGVSDASSDSRY